MSIRSLSCPVAILSATKQSPQRDISVRPSVRSPRQSERPTSAFSPPPLPSTVGPRQRRGSADGVNALLPATRLQRAGSISRSLSATPPLQAFASHHDRPRLPKNSTHNEGLHRAKVRQQRQFAQSCKTSLPASSSSESSSEPHALLG